MLAETFNKYLFCLSYSFQVFPKSKTIFLNNKMEYPVSIKIDGQWGFQIEIWKVTLLFKSCTDLVNSRITIEVNISTVFKGIFSCGFLNKVHAAHKTINKLIIRISSPFIKILYLLQLGYKKANQKIKFASPRQPRMKQIMHLSQRQARQRYERE